MRRTARFAARIAQIATASALAAGALACGPKEGAGPPVGVSDKGTSSPVSDRPLTFVFESIDERPFSSTAMRGKPAVITFVTTGDLVGQAQVDFLVAMAKTDPDDVNYGLVALHPRKELPLVQAYATTLGVSFPVAIADASAMNDAGPFGEIPAVPTTVVLGRDGRLVWKHTGLAKSDELRAHMRGL